MVTRLLLLFSAATFFSLGGHSQALSNDETLRGLIIKYGEAQVTVAYTDNKTLDYLTRNVSVLSVADKMIEISLSSRTVEWFIRQKFNYVIKQRIEPKGIVSAASAAGVLEWDKYPTYSQYDSVMQSFASLYPSLCHVDTIGTSINGKLVLAVGITGDAGNDRPKTEVFYTSTMHGNETGGFVLMLRLADFLLRNYPSDGRVKNLLDNLSIWINPLANPDGTYNQGDTIKSPVRFNADGVDLNRNFPDPQEPGIVQEKETVDMIRFMREHRFVISANFHSGTEVVNYPWDSWLTKLHADNNWFYDISRGYADTVHVYSAPGYMTFLDNGVTRGAVWYLVFGGRQDYVTRDLQGREVTIEIDNQYITPAAELPVLWENNRRSLLGYLENAIYGIHGLVLDSLTSDPVAAKVFIAGHDKDSSQVYSDALNGTFVRLLSPGIWAVTFTAGGYRDTTMNIDVYAGQRTDINVILAKNVSGPDTTVPEVPALYPNPATTEIKALLPDELAGSVNIMIINQSGKLIADYNSETQKGIPVIIDVRRMAPGTYYAVFKNIKKNKSCHGKFIVIK